MQKIRYILVLLLFFSCSDDDDNFKAPVIASCGVANVAEDITWLREVIAERENSSSEDRKYCFVFIAMLEEEHVFVLDDCNPLIDKAIPILNCEGTVLNTAENPIVFDELSDKTLLWIPDNFACNLNF